MECGWNIQQNEVGQTRIHAVAFIIAILIAVLLVICFAGPSFWGDKESIKVELPGGINPNDAPVASLVRLPGLGGTLANEIINYREKFKAENGGEYAFKKCEDLDRVKGIGPKKIEQMRDWLKFE